MKIKTLHLVNFRNAKDLRMDFDPNLNLFVGINGAGKTTVLSGIAILLSQVVARLRSPKGFGRKILNSDIHNLESHSILEITCQSSTEDDECTWHMTQTRKGRNPVVKADSNFVKSNFEALNAWAYSTRQLISDSNEKINIPLFVYYPVNRSVLDIPLRIRNTHNFELLEAYDSAFTVGANFRDFFEWFRNREDYENERFRDATQTDTRSAGSGKFIEDMQLTSVRVAINNFLPEFSSISVKRNPLRMEVEKLGRKYNIKQMSDGEKCLMALVGDLARRLAIANPNRENALEGDGVVLIDEIDLHLHPAWQRSVVPRLIKTFPNCQFVITTHSPQVLGEVHATCVKQLYEDQSLGLISTTPAQSYGLDTSSVLEELMETKSRNTVIEKKLDEIFHRIDSDDFAKAKEIIEEVRQMVNGDIPDLVRANSIISMLQSVDGE